MNFTNLCGPVVLYLGFSLIQIIIDIFRQHFNVALLKFIVMIVFGTVLNILCSKNLTLVAWLLVFIPFIFMTVITTLLLIAFGLDPQGNLINKSNNNLVNPSNNLDTLPCNEIYSENLCLNNKCEWVQMEGEPTSGICKFSNKFGKRIGREIGNEIAYSLINNQNQNIIGGDPATWGPPETNNQNIGGDPATWGPPETNNQNIGDDPATWGPPETNNQNIGGDPATWGPPETNNQNIGGDPATWGPPETNNQNIGGDPATWGPPETNNQNKNIKIAPSYIKNNMGENYKN